MTRRLNRDHTNDAHTTILQALARTIGGASAHVLNAFACVAPALASTQAYRAAGDTAGAA
ncbi:hypothetical protein [Burkholderia metallica]|uniref:hypothetical protein n=1 Tax=Burkholderia metallica TaxID=488729 RepID=UPI001452C819|nr:hypothetical protein [Burkholderia metallica]VWB05422.1 hypothetical protein BME24068_00047 [Burkholderia metallica]